MIARFFLLTLLVSVPFYHLAIVWPVQGLPFGLPISAAMIVAPAGVATSLVFRERGWAGARDLWRRVADVHRVRGARWFLFSLLCLPVVSLGAWLLMRGLDLPLPEPLSIPWYLAPVAFITYFVGAIFEEIGWTGYATEPLQRRYGVLRAGLLIGAVWAAWHLIPWWIIQGRSPVWIGAQSLATVAMRVIMGWIHARGGGSLLLAIVFHAMINTSYSLFPNGGSHYDPCVTALLLSSVAAILAFQQPGSGAKITWPFWGRG